MSFGGGGGSSTGVNAHWHNSQTDNGGPLKANNDITTGTSITYSGGSETVIESLTVL
mgnify:FL=1